MATVLCEVCGEDATEVRKVIDPETDAYVWAEPSCAEQLEQDAARRADTEDEQPAIDALVEQMRGL